VQIWVHILVRMKRNGVIGTAIYLILRWLVLIEAGDTENRGKTIT